MKRNILIFHSGALGDFIVTWPLAVALGRIFAQSRIIYITAGQKGELARHILGVEAIDSEQGWHVLFAPGAALQPPLSKWVDGASHIISFVCEPGDVWHENIRRLAPEAQLTCIRPRPIGEYAGHITQYLIDQLADFPMLQQGAAQIVSSLAHRPIKARSIEPTHIIIHPGAGGLQKCWPAEKYLQLIERLRQGGARVRVLLGEAERDRWSADLIARFESAAETVWPGSYVELLEELRQAKVFIGNDSGPGHLAGIIGVPTVVLFAASNASQWRPLGPSVKILAIPFEELAVAEVLTEVERIQG